MQQHKTANLIVLKQLNTQNPLEMNSIELRPVFCDGFSHPGFFQACATCRPSMACKWGASLNLLLSLNKKLQMPSAAGMQLRAKNLDLDTNLLMMRKTKHGKFVRSDHEQADHHHKCGNWHVCAFNSEACDKLHTEGIQSQPKTTENAQRILLLQHEESQVDSQLITHTHRGVHAVSVAGDPSTGPCRSSNLLCTHFRVAKPQTSIKLPACCCVLILKQLNTKNPLEMNSILELNSGRGRIFTSWIFPGVPPTCRPSMAVTWPHSHSHAQLKQVSTPKRQPQAHRCHYTPSSCSH
jgi:hypothetical protein